MVARHALILLLLSTAISACLDQTQNDDASDVTKTFTIEADLANNGSKEALVWLNITPPRGPNVSFEHNVAGHERVGYNQTLDANGTYRIEVTWFTEGERLDAGGQEVYSDSFTSRVNFAVNATRCSDAEAFTVSSNATYVRSDSPLLAPLTNHRLETETRYNGCDSSVVT